MKIKVTETEKIQAALDAVQKRANVRTLSSSDIRNYTRLAESVLDRFMLPKAERKGVRARVGYQGEFPGAYKYTPEGTICTMERGADSWFLVSCDRAGCAGRDWLIYTEMRNTIFPQFRNSSHS